MSFQKFTGKTLEEAIANAANTKNVTPEEITYNINCPVPGTGSRECRKYRRFQQGV